MSGAKREKADFAAEVESVLSYKKKSFCTRCNGHHEREGAAEEKCQVETQFARADHRRRGGTI